MMRSMILLSISSVFLFANEDMSFPPAKTAKMQFDEAVREAQEKQTVVWREKNEQLIKDLNQARKLALEADDINESRRLGELVRNIKRMSDNQKTPYIISADFTVGKERFDVLKTVLAQIDAKRPVSLRELIKDPLPGGDVTKNLEVKIIAGHRAPVPSDKSVFSTKSAQTVIQKYNEEAEELSKKNEQAMTKLKDGYIQQLTVARREALEKDLLDESQEIAVVVKKMRESKEDKFNIKLKAAQYMHGGFGHGDGMRLVGGMLDTTGEVKADPKTFGDRPDQFWGLQTLTIDVEIAGTPIKWEIPAFGSVKFDIVR